MTKNKKYTYNYANTLLASFERIASPLHDPTSLCQEELRHLTLKHKAGKAALSLRAKG